MAPEADDAGPTDGHGDVPAFSDSVWQKFLTDTEDAIRASARREPSARERAGRMRQHPAAGDEETIPPTRREAPKPEPLDAVGELWEPEASCVYPPWRCLDNRARRRRVGRVLTAVAAVLLAVEALSWLLTTPGAPAETVRDGTSQQSESAPPDGAPEATAPADNGGSPAPAAE
ncbi:hypothetical protein [Streptomyces sp. MAI_2237]